MTRSLISFLLASFVATGVAVASDHHCKLPDGSFDGSKTEQQCGAAKGTWVADATYTGTLQTNVAAIGGETTGITLGSNELDLHGDAALIKAASALDGKQVAVTGYLTIKHGVEIHERHIIVVSSLRAK